MSAWYVLSALALYQVAPGLPVYEIGTPQFDAATIHIAGKKFVIRAPGASSGKFYIQSAKLNGKPLTRPWITHQQLAAGGELDFVMSAQPNKQWAAALAGAPPSLSTSLH
jgi:putative alpha-1,2-mannosidase